MVPGRGLKEQALKFGGPAAKLLEQLCDLSYKRIAEMDAARIDLQNGRLLPASQSNSNLQKRRHSPAKRTITR
jgi:hypothetical protein